MILKRIPLLMLILLAGACNACFCGFFQSGKDNLGNHIATKDLNMSTHRIVNTSTITFSDGTLLTSSATLGGGGFTNPATVNLDMNSHSIDNLQVINNNGSTAIGNGTSTSGNNGTVAIGYNSAANGQNGGVAIGYDATSNNNNGSTSIGRGTTASGGYGSTTMGYYSTSGGGFGTMAVGYYTQANADSSFAFGNSLTNGIPNSLMVGFNDISQVNIGFPMSGTLPMLFVSSSSVGIDNNLSMSPGLNVSTINYINQINCNNDSYINGLGVLQISTITAINRVHINSPDGIDFVNGNAIYMTEPYISNMDFSGSLDMITAGGGAQDWRFLANNETMLDISSEAVTMGTSNPANFNGNGLNMYFPLNMKNQPITFNDGTIQTTAAKSEDSAGTPLNYTEWISTQTVTVGTNTFLDIVPIDSVQLYNVVVSNTNAGINNSFSYNVWTTSFTVTNNSLTDNLNIYWRAVGSK